MLPQNPISSPTAQDVAKRAIALRYVVDYAYCVQREEMEVLVPCWSEQNRYEVCCDMQVQRDEFWSAARRLGCYDYLTPLEKQFADTTAMTMTRQQHRDALWRQEALQVLLWALGLLPDLPPCCQPAHGHALQQAMHCRTPQVYLAYARLRPEAQLNKERVAALIWFWRSVLFRGWLRPKSRIGIDKATDTLLQFSRDVGCIDSFIDGDLPVRHRPFREITMEETAEIEKIADQRMHALNWLCGYATGWD